MDCDEDLDPETKAIHAAMMEELGLGRRDALPLEDRHNGPSIGVLPTPKKRLPTDSATAAWHCVEDETDSTDEKLPDIAGGQLYRERKNAVDNGRGRGCHANGSSGRSRGGISTRGGHSSTGGRGGQSAQRGSGRIEKRGTFNPGGTQTYFNDARHQVNNHQELIRGMARLHSEAKHGNAEKKIGVSTKLPSKPSRAPPPSTRRPASSSYNLASPEAFLAHAQVGSSPSVKPAHTAASEILPSSALDTLATLPSPALHSQQNVGTVTSVASVSENPSSDPLETANRVVVEERNSVKISMNKSAPRSGIARLIKFDDVSPLRLELQVDDKLLVNDVLTESATLQVDGSFVTYRTCHETDRSNMWRIQFQLPGPAQKFANTHNFRLGLLRRSGYSSRPLEQQRTTPHVTVPSSAASTTSNTTNAFPSVPTDSFRMNRISSGTYADLAIIDGHQVLVSLEEDERHFTQEDNNEKPATTSLLEDLLSLMDGDIVSHTLQRLNADYGGSFIDHVSQMAKGTDLENDQDFLERSKRVFGGGLSSSRFAKPISEITEELVENFFKKSETFSSFPPSSYRTYIQETSKKILEKAQSSRNDKKTSIKVESAGVVAELASPKVVGEKILQSMEPDSGDTLNKTVQLQVDSDSDNLSGASRIVYSSDQILDLRTGYEPISGKLLCDLNQIPRLVQPKKPKSITAPAAFPKLSPEEWKTRFGSAQADHDTAQSSKSSNIHAKEKETKNSEVPSPAALPETVVNNTGQNVDLNASQFSDKHSHSKHSGDVSSVTSAEPQEIKKEVQNDDLMLALRKNGGLSSSKYADKSPVNQASVLRATSGFQVTSRQTTLDAPRSSNISSNKSNSSLNPVAPVQEHDHSLWNTLLATKKSPEVKASKPSVITPKEINIASTGDQKFAVGSEQEKPNSAYNAKYTDYEKLIRPTLVSQNEGKILAASGAQETKSNEPETITLVSKPKVPTSTNLAHEKQQPARKPGGARHHPTDSDCERLVACMDGLDLKTEGDSPDTSPMNAPRKASPTAEELLARKRPMGLATSKWALEGGAPEFKPPPKNLTPIVTEYKQSSKSTYQDYPDTWASHMPAAPVRAPLQVSDPVYQTVLIPDPVTGGLIEVTGMVKTGSVPVVAHMPVLSPPQQYFGNSNSFSSPSSVPFPPRPSMLEPRPFSDSESEEGLKPTAQVFTPSRTVTCGTTTALRPALSPVRRENSMTQQDIQERLNRSLARRGGSRGRQ
ncbi:Bgh specific protein [Rutstroemia sp. NJR-2017a BBW]|nr:Bgh specific protein [Rutstroemia sp. NJR-2017a BBW]